MNELICAAGLIATLFGGTAVVDKVFVKVRKAALMNAAKGLPPLTNLAGSLTKRKK